MHPIAYAIRKIKEDKHLTYRQLGKELNCSHAWLSQVVNGDRLPTLELLESLVTHSGRSYDFIMNYYRPTIPGAQIDEDLVRELFRRGHKNQRHIYLDGTPSKIEQKVIDNIKSVTTIDFNQITLNQRNQLRSHSHRNQGESYIYLFGDFTGGALCFEDGHQVTERNKWVLIDGGTPHYVAPFKGDRYSIVLYNR